MDEFSVRQVFETVWGSGTTEFQNLLRWVAIIVAAAGFAFFFVLKTKGRNGGYGGMGSGGLNQIAQKISLPAAIVLALFALAPDVVLGVVGALVDVVLMAILGIARVVAGAIFHTTF